jgi:hypothetical protein
MGLRSADCTLQTAENEHSIESILDSARECYLGRSPLHGGPSDGFTGASEPCQTMLRIQQTCRDAVLSPC